MTTIRLPDEGEFSEAVERHFIEIRKAERARFGIPRISNIWRCMAHWPAYVEATWRKSKAVWGPGRLDALIRECVASAVSISNVCRY